MDPYFYFFIRLLSDFFSFLCQDANKNKIKMCYNRLQFVKETQTNTL